MRWIGAVVLLAGLVAFLPVALPQKSDSPFEGRWDLTITTPQNSYPSWLEVTGQQVRLVGRESSVHAANEVKIEGGRLSFTTMEWFGKRIPVTWHLSAANGRLSGVQERGDGVKGKIEGVAAPALKRPLPTQWLPPTSLFNGKDLTGWQPYTIPDKTATNHWKAVNGELLNEAPGTNLRTTATFQDFKLHLEYNCPSGGNSGVYLRGRYEVQVDYEPAGTNDALHGMGSIYGFLAPAAKVDPRPGQWESYDITLVGRTVTVVRNGTTTINQQEIPGITGGALDSHEELPGPFYLQGDHTGGMKYRNITIALPKR